MLAGRVRLEEEAAAIKKVGLKFIKRLMRLSTVCGIVLMA